MRELTIPALIKNIDTVTEFVNSELEKYNCPQKARVQINVAIDELFGNIAHYAYSHHEGNATVQVTFEKDPRAVVITFIDKGIPYNPLQKEDPDVTLSAEDRKIGGLGIYMVKKIMDAVEYKYEDGHNTIRIIKRI
jgi:anti-sigma regulatory factor (Ser/Thr protein kinase)